MLVGYFTEYWSFYRGGWVKRQGVVQPTCPIRFITYNIWNGQNVGLESALRGISYANMDLGVSQETNLT